MVVGRPVALPVRECHVAGSQRRLRNSTQNVLSVLMEMRAGGQYDVVKMSTKVTDGDSADTASTPDPADHPGRPQATDRMAVSAWRRWARPAGSAGGCRRGGSRHGFREPVHPPSPGRAAALFGAAPVFVNAVSAVRGWHDRLRYQIAGTTSPTATTSGTTPGATAAASPPDHQKCWLRSVVGVHVAWES